MVRALLLDLYDTLAWIDERARHERCLRLAERAGVSADRLAEQWRRTGQDRGAGRLGPPARELGQILAACGRPAGDDLLAELVALDADLWELAVHLYDDVLPGLERLRAHGVRLGLVSNCSWPTKAVVDRSGLAGRLDAVVLSFEAGVSKPDPAILRLALERLGAEAAEAAFVDDVEAYLDAGRALGLRTFRIDRRGAAAANRHEPVRDLPSLYERISTTT